MNQEMIAELAWEKMQNLIPVVIQHYQTLQVLMLGYMDIAALQQTIHSGRVTFYSRSKQRLWIKGEMSGNYLNLIKILPDCDNDSLLMLVDPVGSSCHKGNDSCFNDSDNCNKNFFGKLESIIDKRYQDKPDNSYTTQLFNAGLQRIVQKVGEEAIETILAATSGNKQQTISETADLLYHLLVLLRCCGITLAQVNLELMQRSCLNG
jgi:phosphoribosyl-AMP cyclohydrolase / phosphoribosyl-ATP pyrophosphohydrolase